MTNKRQSLTDAADRLDGTVKWFNDARALVLLTLSVLILTFVTGNWVVSFLAGAGLGVGLASLVLARGWYPKWKQIHDIDHPEDVYLSRLMLLKTPWLGVYLHIIRRPDWARCQHDHPWSFVTCILRGGYEEQVGDQFFTRRPGYVGYRPRSFEHRITKLLAGNAVTLVVRFKNHHSWGFRLWNGTKVMWESYVKMPSTLRVFWCDDRSQA